MHAIVLGHVRPGSYTVQAQERHAGRLATTLHKHAVAPLGGLNTSGPQSPGPQ